ncbi:hypothetical protein [Paenibacillus sp. UNC451MF]|uniref:hypothetical protein n=1 Tax=Paenibacillus sp. UNC451MF TaxID=1449063 RepID=UPI00049196E8|nr:hypothetical protein [Paenibacillus sp. UNC451MF]
MITLAVFDNVMVTGNQTVKKDFQVDGNQTIMKDLRVNGNQSVMNDFKVVGDQTIKGSLQVNGSETIKKHLSVGGDISAKYRLGVRALPTVPPGPPTGHQVRYFASSIANQPGLLLKGTDGNDYILFIDTTGGTPHLAIQKA